jgi:2-polyprenyl-3-methyl-5-hydroxy-6-metoxy-1,4-benzoquinol methylase
MRDETTDFPDRSFDLVISVEVLEHVGDVTKSAKEIDRLLAGGADHAVRQSLFDRVV